MSHLRFAAILALAFATLATSAPGLPAAEGINESRLASIDGALREAIQKRECPGAVVFVGHQGKIAYRRALGNRSLVPRKLPMTEDTIFDIASLTKVVATTTAVMQLVEQGKIRLEDAVSKYWPEFEANGKQEITVRELLTHYSGLPPDLDLKPPWSGYETAMKMIVAAAPVDPPGTRFIYSDVNFETLGELARRVSGQPLDVYCSEHIFKPLGMKDTRFNPPRALRTVIAPTEYQYGTSGKMLWGAVHDPTAYNMGGVSGHAGVFSTAADLAVFAQMLLDGGSSHGVRILSPLAIEKMTTAQNPWNQLALRGLGWDIDSSFSSNRGDFFPIGSYGHTGFTGTSIWIDPVSQTYVIFLSNRVHPDGKGDVVSLRARVASIVAAALDAVQGQEILARPSPLTGYAEIASSYRIRGARNGQVETGIDVLEAESFAPLAGLRVGLITNQTGRDRQGRRTVDLLYRAHGVELKAIFGPEHGLAGTAAEGAAESSHDAATGLPVYSLYGETARPTDTMLEGLDALVFDIQDVGVRFYTYTTTLAYAMEAAAKKGLTVFVLDRPNPINGLMVEGPMLDRDLTSFVGYFPMPIRHGMTVGELAEMFNAENKIGVKLVVIKMRGWERPDWFDETGLTWVDPSPNLRNLTEAILYPGVAMVEGANVSVGRGTDTPFELVGAPWIDGRELAAYLNKRQIQGVRFLPIEFSPRSGPFAGVECRGVSLIVLNRLALDSPALGLEIVAALYKLYPHDFEIEKTLPLIGSRRAVEGIKQGRDPRTIVLHGFEDLNEFRRIRAKYLLYR